MEPFLLSGTCEDMVLYPKLPVYIPGMLKLILTGATIAQKTMVSVSLMLAMAMSSSAVRGVEHRDRRRMIGQRYATAKEIHRNERRCCRQISFFVQHRQQKLPCPCERAKARKDKHRTWRLPSTRGPGKSCSNVRDRGIGGRSS